MTTAPMVTREEHTSVDLHAEPSRRWSTAMYATAVAGIAWIALFAADGSPLWRLVRVGFAAALTVALLTTTAHRAARGWAGLLLGTVTTIAGAGIGVPHAVKSGASAMALVGLGLLASGLVMIVTGAIDALAGRARWQRRAAVPVVALVVIVASLALVPAVMVTNAPRPGLGARSPADVGLTYEDVEFVTSDGVLLSGWYVPSSNGAAVVLRHGAGSTRTSVLDHAAVLSDHGYGVLLADARGHGRSGGRAMDLGWYGDEDVSASLTFLANRADVRADRIAVLGLSMGGEEAIGAAAADARISAVVAEGATARSNVDLGWLSDRYGVRGWIQERFEWVRSTATDVLTDADKPTALVDAVAAAAPRPVLLITAGDVDDERFAAEHLAGAAPGSVSVWEVVGAGHTGGLATDRAGWTQRVTAFLDAALRS